MIHDRGNYNDHKSSLPTRKLYLFLSSPESPTSPPSRKPPKGHESPTSSPQQIHTGRWWRWMQRIDGHSGYLRRTFASPLMCLMVANVM